MQEGGFNIQLTKIKTVLNGVVEKDVESIRIGNLSIGGTKVNTRFLIEAASNKSSLAANNVAIIIVLVGEEPIG